MWRLFITLYVFLVAFVLITDNLIDVYIYTYHYDALVEDSAKDYNSLLQTLDYFTRDVSLEELKEVLVEANKDTNLPIEAFAASAVQERYLEALSRPNKHNLFFLNFDDQQFLYQMQNQEIILKIGPIDTIAELDEIVTNIEYTEWLLLAVVIFLWQFILWRKLTNLEKNVVAFGNGNLSARASTSAANRVGKLNAAFNSMAEKTSQLVQNNKQLIRAVSHELRAPIARIRCLVDLLQDNSARSENAKYLDDMSKDITELEKLVDEILNYSRLEASGELISSIREQHLKPLLTCMLNTINREFSTDIPLACDSTICAAIDETHFHRAVRNLVHNAARYCSDVVEVSVVADERISLVHVHIDDDGPGIPKNERKHIFEPFARLDQSRTRDSGGYGLGLAIVKQIANRHGGDVQISTSPLGGSRFTFSVPICTEKQAAS